MHTSVLVQTSPVTFYFFFSCHFFHLLKMLGWACRSVEGKEKLCYSHLPFHRSRFAVINRNFLNMLFNVVCSWRKWQTGLITERENGKVWGSVWCACRQVSSLMILYGWDAGMQGLHLWRGNLKVWSARATYWPQHHQKQDDNDNDEAYLPLLV